jgi:16S rRNA (cytidine1402-2'-O)-methyltransferase
MPHRVLPRPGALYLIPTLLGGTDPTAVLPPRTLALTRELRRFVVENAKSARAFLKLVEMPLPLAELDLQELNEHTPEAAIAGLLAPALAGEPLGLLSEAGCPAVADPGARLIAIAHTRGLAVVPMVGPSSILLGLMASGLNGQAFVFHGYLPTKPPERIAALRRVEEAAWKNGATQGFIETPYRNVALLEALCATCRKETLLCVAADLTLDSESVRTKTIGAWTRESLTNYAKRPAIFFLGQPA